MTIDPAATSPWARRIATGIVWLAYFAIYLSLKIALMSILDIKLALPLVLLLTGAFFIGGTWAWPTLRKPADHLAPILDWLGKRYGRLPLTIQAGTPFLAGVAAVGIACSSILRPHAPGSNPDLLTLLGLVAAPGLAAAGAIWRKGVPGDARILRTLKFLFPEDSKDGESWMVVVALVVGTVILMSIPEVMHRDLPQFLDAPFALPTIVAIFGVGTIGCGAASGALGMHLRLLPRRAPSPDPMITHVSPPLPKRELGRFGRAVLGIIVTLGSVVLSMVMGLVMAGMVAFVVYVYVTPAEWVLALLFVFMQAMCAFPFGAADENEHVWAPGPMLSLLLHVFVASFAIAWLLTAWVLWDGHLGQSPDWFRLVGFAISQLIALLVVISSARMAREDQRASDLAALGRSA